MYKKKLLSLSLVGTGRFLDLSPFSGRKRHAHANRNNIPTRTLSAASEPCWNQHHCYPHAHGFKFGYSPFFGVAPLLPHHHCGVFPSPAFRARLAMTPNSTRGASALNNTATFVFRSARTISSFSSAAACQMSSATCNGPIAQNNTTRASRRGRHRGNHSLDQN